MAKVNVDAGTRSEPEVRKHVLPNGLTLLLREDPRLPLVSVLAAFRAGTLAETDAAAAPDSNTAYPEAVKRREGSVGENQSAFTASFLHGDYFFRT